MFVDTCHSGGACNTRLVNDAANANIIVSVLTLGDFISQEVANLTLNKQQPKFHMSGAKNFMLAKEFSAAVVPVVASPAEAKNTAPNQRPKRSEPRAPDIWNRQCPH